MLCSFELSIKKFYNLGARYQPQPENKALCISKQGVLFCGKLFHNLQNLHGICHIGLNIRKPDCYE